MTFIRVQRAKRISLENNESIISYPTIYRSIYNGPFNEVFLVGSSGVRKMLRRKGRESVNKRIGNCRGRFTDVKRYTNVQLKLKTEKDLGTGKQILSWDTEKNQV